MLQVFSGARPLLEKTLGILVEGLIDTFLSLFHENKTKDLKSLDANGFCQLMLEVNVQIYVCLCWFLLILRGPCLVPWERFGLTGAMAQVQVLGQPFCAKKGRRVWLSPVCHS